MFKKITSLGIVVLGISATAQDSMELSTRFFDHAIKSRFGEDISVGVPEMREIQPYDIEFFEVKLGEKLSYGVTSYAALDRAPKIDEMHEILVCKQEGKFTNCYRGIIGQLTRRLRFSEYFSPASELEMSRSGDLSINIPEVSPYRTMQVSDLDEKLHELYERTTQISHAYRFVKSGPQMQVKTNWTTGSINPAQQHCLAEQVKEIDKLKQDRAFNLLSDELHRMGIRNDRASISLEVSLMDHSLEKVATPETAVSVERISQDLDYGLRARINSVMTVEKQCVTVNSLQLLGLIEKNDDVKAAELNIKARNQVNNLF